MYIESDKGIKRKQLTKSVSVFEKDEDKIVNSIFDQNLKFLMK